MKVLIACEKSQIICKAFRLRGHEAFSNDILPCRGGRPEWHLQCDTRDLLTVYFDLVIFHPECRFIANSGSQWLKYPGRFEKMVSACDFFNLRHSFNSPAVCTENPVPHGEALKRIGKYSQIIQPYYFGDQYQKTTCLWLKGLPKLFHSKHVTLFDEKTHVYKGDTVTFSSGRKMAAWMNKAKSGNQAKTSETRSNTFPGIAAAMATQWG